MGQKPMSQKTQMEKKKGLDNCMKATTLQKFSTACVGYLQKHTTFTEKEVEIILFLKKMNKEVKINQLQKEVWGYQSKLDTHTVETHIYRLRKKFNEKFNDINFIESSKNGYSINEKKK